MSETTPHPVVVVTGANGLVGEAVCRALVEREAQVRAVVRRPGTAPTLAGVEEHVGDFSDPQLAAEVVEDVDAVVTTVHPLGDDPDVQRQVAVQGTAVLARAAREAGVPMLVHVSTAAVYDRSPESGDVDERSDLVGDVDDAYATSKRDTDQALAEVDGITRVLLRPPAILGPGETSIWNTLRPAQIRDQGQAPRTAPDKSFAWVHVADLAALAADLATGRIPTADDPETGPVAGACTPLNVAAEPATQRDYLGAVAEALGVDTHWVDEPAWQGRIVADRAHRWGWRPRVGLDEALRELRDDLHPAGEPRTD
jgi:2-alkyl-3-oxoalkanoate reductase